MKIFTIAMLGIFVGGIQYAFGAPTLVLCSPTGTSCSACTSYRCNSGYYGAATSASTGCIKCPSNATCAGGNDSTFVCDKGYYKNGTLCSRCPSSGSVYGTTAKAGATAPTECYIPALTSFSDESGTGVYTENCYYQN